MYFKYKYYNNNNIQNSFKFTGQLNEINYSFVVGLPDLINLS